jgi:hypothetical protein
MVKDRIWSQYGSLKNYVEKLADATKPMLNLSAMSNEEWKEVAGLVQNGELEKI